MIRFIRKLNLALLLGHPIYTFLVQIFGAKGLGLDSPSRVDFINLRDTTECNDEETDSIQTRRHLPSDKVTCLLELCLLSHNSHCWSS